MVKVASRQLKCIRALCEHLVLLMLRSSFSIILYSASHTARQNKNNHHAAAYAHMHGALPQDVINSPDPQWSEN